MKLLKLKGPTFPLLLAALCVLCSPTFAQQDTTPPPAEPTLKPNPEAALRAFEPPADAPYELGPGDEITVEAVGRPELTGKHVVGPDGKITLPIIGTIQVADKTREGAAQEIEKQLATFYSDVTVVISIDKYTSNQVLLLGAVDHPGVMTFDKTPTLLEVISRGGVVTKLDGLGPPGVKPTGIPDECIIYRGNDTMITVELKALLDSASPLANLRLKRNDIVYVTGHDKFVSVLGQVSHPGNLRLETGTTLSELISEAGGPTEKAGKNPAIEIIHRSSTQATGHTQKIRFNTMLQSNPLDLTLQSGDIVFVTESGFNAAAYTIEKLAPLVNLFTVSSLLVQ